MVQYLNRRSIRADARRVEIMRAAARVFRLRGFAAAGMRDIAVAAETVELPPESVAILGR